MMKRVFPKREKLKAQSPALDAIYFARRVSVSDCLAFEGHIPNFSGTDKPMSLSDKHG